MLSTTTHLTTDVVAVPLLWVLPLGIYLLSFVLAFSGRRSAVVFVTQVAPLVILIAGGLAFADGSQRPLFSATLGLSLLLFVSVSLHGEMYRLRPAPDRLTGFYLAMSVGGVIGGAFCAILAPTIFTWSYEHPLLILAAALLLPQRNFIARIERLWDQPRLRYHLFYGIPLIALGLSVLADRQTLPELPSWAAVATTVAIGLLSLVSIGRRVPFALCLLALMMGYGGWSEIQRLGSDMRTRSYFGIYTVTDSPKRITRTLTHGTTLHGIQNLIRGLEEVPTSYYTFDSGVGMALDAVPALYGPDASVGVIGLGTGTLACYRVPNQRWTFFEIDPAMVGIATDPKKFSYLSRCAPQARIVLGDARLTLARQPPGSFNLIAVDAFSSDSVPMHLLTREALGVYGRALTPDGLLLMHISNRYLNLEPVLAAGARTGGWATAIVRYSPDGKDPFANAAASVWVAMSRDPAMLQRLKARSGAPDSWKALEARPGFAGWTDDYASILPLIEGWTN
jgi:SAM-dependent methyltransferase